MRITLIHNPQAGRGNHHKKVLMSALASAGHHAIYQSTKKEGYEKLLKQSTDLVLVAGGDGTVRKVGRELINSGIALSVLPLGTANNLARSLGFTASVEQIIAGLRNGKKRFFDVGLASGPWGQRYFFESAGGGLLADYFNRAGKTRKTKTVSKEQEMMHHVSNLRRMLHGSATRNWRINIDGKEITNEYILWEAMNVRSAGPALYLALQATTKDGRFDFVCAREEHRSVLFSYLDARLAGRISKFPLPCRRFRELKVTYEKSPLHFDGKCWPSKYRKATSSTEIDITVKPSALVILQSAVNLNG